MIKRIKHFLFHRNHEHTVKQEIPLTTVFRWYIYDTGLTDEPNNIAEVVGLSRISEEDEDKEIEDSEERLSALVPLLPFLESMSDISAQTMTAIHLKELVDEGELDDQELLEEGEEMANSYKAVALSTLVGVFSIALNLGIIQHETLITSVDYLGDTNE